MKIRYIVTETGPNGDSEVIVKTEAEARELVRIGKEYWKDAIIFNKVPERTYIIGKFTHEYNLDEE